MMGRWRIEASDDGVIWEEILDFFFAHHALRAFDFELARGGRQFVRLIAPDGAVHERAVLHAC